MAEKKRILLICPGSDIIVTFRKNLIEKLQSEGYDVSAIAFSHEREKTIREMGVDFYPVEDSNRSVNPFKVLAIKKTYYKLIKKINPDKVITFTLKPNTFGVAACKKAGITEVYSMVEGAGDVFINNTFKWKIIRQIVCLLYRKAFKYSKKVFFQNTDDIKEFTERKLVKNDKCVLINGIGVDTERFDHQPLTSKRTFIMVARMLKTKGIFEYCECARMVKKSYPDAVFNYLGAESTVKKEDIKEYIEDGSINYLGETTDVRPFLKDCTAMILPTYREGLPVSVMEAESVGRAIIISDTVGCKTVIKDGYNGFFCEKGNAGSFAEKATWIIDHPEEAEEMGNNSRKFACENFDQKKINDYIFRQIEEN